MGDGERDLKIDAWKMRREKLSAAFDAECHALAKEFIAFQSQQLRDAIRRYNVNIAAIAAGKWPDTEIVNRFLIVDQKELSQMSLSIRKMQEVGRMALGETTDRRQLDLPFDKLPDITVNVVYGSQAGSRD